MVKRLRTAARLPASRQARGCFVGLLLLAMPAFTEAQEARQAAFDQSFETRRDMLLAANIARPFPDPTCRTQPPSPDLCMKGQINLALALLQASADPAGLGRANSLLQAAVERLPRTRGWKRLADPENAEESALLEPSTDFPFLTATLLYRAVALFGSSAPPSQRRLAAPTERGIRDLFWSWASTECRIAEADPAMVWRPWASENHDVQRSHACWAAAELLRDLMPGEPHTYADGSTPAQQDAAWSAYFKAFIRARAGGGGPVEFFSAVYSKYFLSVFYNMLDFASDAELRSLAENFVTLWWARWAEEQIGGIHGGSKARFHPRAMMAGVPAAGLPWLYLGIGERPRAIHPANMPMVLSHYRLPDIVRDIALDTTGRGEYEVWSRQLGLATGPIAGRRYLLSPDIGALTRYTFVTPGYVMGASLFARLPKERWTGISMQNRWFGVVLADSPDARVFAVPDPKGKPSTYNSIIGTQSRGTQIVQRIPPPLSGSAGNMRIWVGPRLRPIERDGWIFVEGSAFVAARPAFGGYVADPSGASYRLLDQRSPVIIQAGTRTTYTSFEAFQAAVLAAPLRVSRDSIEFEGLDGAGRLRFFLEGDRPAERDGRPIQVPPEWSLYSPFIRQRRGDSTVEITKGERRLVLRFDGSYAH